MFYDGDLHSGIAFALRESKSVACFVTDNGDEGVLWQTQYLTDQQVLTALAAKAVTLCIRAGSREAQYLSAYYPIPEIPSFTLIRNGQLILDLRPGETQHTFKTAILKSLSAISPPLEPISTTASDLSQGLDSNASPQSEPRTSVISLASTLSTSAGPSSTPTPPGSDTTQPSESSGTGNIRGLLTPAPSNARSPALESLFMERSLKLEKDKEQKEAAEKAEQKSKAEERKAAMVSDPTSAKAKQMTYAQQQKHRQIEAKLERDRIVRQIELDKVERRENEERRKALAMVEAEDKELNEHYPLGPKASVPHGHLISSRDCSLQIRLFDGSNIRQRFSPSHTLRKAVRQWVDEQRPEGDTPYTFSQILTPLPNRTLSISEEEDTLQNLGLVPSATLVLIPVQGYTEAYGSNQGFLARGALAGYNVISTGAELLRGAFGIFLGVGRPTNHRQESLNVDQGDEGASTQQNPRTVPSGINIRTLRDQQNDREPHQFYNGNQLNFEPRSSNDDNQE